MRLTPQQRVNRFLLWLGVLAALAAAPFACYRFAVSAHVQRQPAEDRAPQETLLAANRLRLNAPAQPGISITTLTPNIAAVGSKGTIQVTGTGFTDASRVLLNNRALATTVVSETELRAGYYADDFPAAGTYNIKVADANNAQSNTLPFTVTALPSIAEQEPNNGRVTADLLPLPGQRTGHAAEGDRAEITYDYDLASDDNVEDLYAFRLTQSTQVELAVTATATGVDGNIDLFVFRDTERGQGNLSIARLTLSNIDSFTYRVSGERLRLNLAPGRYLVGISARTGGSDYTLTATINPTIAVVSAADYTDFKGIARQSIAALFGTNLTTQTIVATALPLPTTLGGASIKVKDIAGTERDAPLFFVSPGQINFQVPAESVPGVATITVTALDGTVSKESIIIFGAAPAFFTANNNGLGVPAALVLRVTADGTQTYETLARLDPTTNRYLPTPIDLGPTTDRVYLVLYGTGFREARVALTRPSINKVRVPAAAIVALPGFVGLDQINLGPLPRTLIGAGEVDLNFATDFFSIANPSNTVRVNIK